MTDMNTIIAENIRTVLKDQNRKQADLANELNMKKQTVSKMLNGSRMVTAGELKQIADYLEVKMEDLTRVPKQPMETDVVHAFMGEYDSVEAKQALRIAEQLSDMILFHEKVRENGTAMMQPWGDA